MDISKDLVEICKRNAIEAGVQIDFRQGNVSDMPFQSNEFNFIICVLAFKNFKEPIKALEEIQSIKAGWQSTYYGPEQKSVNEDH